MADVVRPDIVVLDLVLPDMDGIEVAKQIAAAASPRPYIIALTGLASAADRIRALAGGVDEVLVKPCDPELLEAAMRAGTMRRTSAKA